MAARVLSSRAAVVAALFDLVLGLALAWVLVRGPFPGRRLVDALADLPSARPTAVAGIALATLWAPDGHSGSVIQDLSGIRIAPTEVGTGIALILVGLP